MIETMFDAVRFARSSRLIGGIEQQWMSADTLNDTCALVADAFEFAGIEQRQRVSVVLPNGPSMAGVFLTVAGAGRCVAPLNPAFKAAEFAFALSDIKPAALILRAGETGPVASVARDLNIPIIMLEEVGHIAGQFRLDMSALPAREVPKGEVEPNDPALVLHTSGTTARPKLVLLSNANLLASARNTAATLALSPDDTCLNVMPLFHIHGLIGAVLSSLLAGAGVCCTPGFNAFRFGEWLDQVRPTWYTAVPTMHQAILARMRGHDDRARSARLRLIRSSSAALPPQVMAEMEELFGAPVVEAYGMTEAAHQIASNVPPPGERRAGTVGRAAGPEIAVVGEGGRPTPPGTIGEVVIRGPNVTAGYDGNPAANAIGFTAGWFRTGDLGWLDVEGVLTLTGRLKEQINRGGEKISPLEIDVVLLDHPAVAEACAFGIPHDTLGEEVGAIVVLREGERLDVNEIRGFAASRLAAFKVPRRILIANEIPKGDTGKIQRVGLAGRLGLYA